MIEMQNHLNIILTCSKFFTRIKLIKDMRLFVRDREKFICTILPIIENKLLLVQNKLNNEATKSFYISSKITNQLSIAACNRTLDDSNSQASSSTTVNSCESFHTEKLDNKMWR